MKKHFFTLGLMLIAALTLTTNCSKQEVLSEENPVTETAKTNVPFALFASSADTKTSTEDGAIINWVALDSLNVFHALSGSTEYGNNDKFVISAENLASNKFTGTLSSALDAESAYDWYALYPYTRYITTPANTNTGYTAIGSANKNTAQRQTGNSSKVHLAGQYFPLYGKATNVAAATTPSITLSQALSVVKIHVTNANEDPLTVSSVSFTAPESIVGQYYINFIGTSPVFTERDGYVSSTANLTVNSGTPLDKNASADFYLAIKPFTAAVAAELTIAVNGYEKTVTIGGSSVNFAPGKIKTINFSYDYVSALSEPTAKTGWYRVEDVSWLHAGDRVILVANASDVAMSTTQNSNNRGLVSVSKTTEDDYKKVTFETDVQQLVLEDSTSVGFFFWNDNGSEANKFLTTASGGNYLRSNFQRTTRHCYAITIDASGNAVVKPVGANTYSIRYNETSSIFSSYTSGQNDIAIYKYYGGTTPTCVAPVISQEGSTITLSTTTPGASIYYTTDGSTPNEEATLYSSPFEIATETNVKAIAIRAHYNESSVTPLVCTPTCATPVITSNGTSFSITC